jgi:hypothetical protein
VFITEMKSVYSAVRTGSYKWSSLRFICKGLKMAQNQKMQQMVNITNIL